MSDGTVVPGQCSSSLEVSVPIRGQTDSHLPLTASSDAVHTYIQ